MRPLCLNCISTIYNRNDKDVNFRIQRIFLTKIKKVYCDLTNEEKIKALSLLQKFRGYSFKFMKSVLTDAIEKWAKNEFETLYTSIEFTMLTKEQISKLKEILWKWRSEANQKKDQDKVDRIDKFLNLDAFR